MKRHLSGVKRFLKEVKKNFRGVYPPDNSQMDAVERTDYSLSDKNDQENGRYFHRHLSV